MRMELSMRIKSLRKIKGYTQKEFANLLGVGQTTVANYESGIRIPDTEKLARIASLFEVTVDYLLGIDEEPFSKKVVNIENIDSKSLDEVCTTFIDLLIKGEPIKASKLINNLHEAGVTIKTLYFEVLGRTLREVGTLWEKGCIDVWKEHYISEIVMDIMRELKVRERKDRNKSYSLLAMTAGPELHNIGIKMITDLLELDGWYVTYLGSNVPVQSAINAIEYKIPDIIVLSVTMPYHIEAAKNTISALKSHFGSKSPKIIVGGGAFLNCRDVCKETGADYYGVALEDVVRAIEKKDTK